MQDGVDSNACRAVDRVSRQLRTILRIKDSLQPCSVETAGLLLAWAYPDRIARQREPGSERYLLESGQGAFGYEYYGSIPRKRWLITKLDLLCAQEVGYALRPSSALASLTLSTQAIAAATTSQLSR